MAHRLIVRSGTWFRYGDQQLGQGRERVRAYLKENPQFTEELRTKILAAGGTVGTTSPAEAEDSAASDD
jgi:recombination protein RecA